MAETTHNEPTRGIEDDTLNEPVPVESADAERRPALTIAWHPDPRRVGDRCFIGTCPGPIVELSRGGPDFVSPTGQFTGPIADRHVSRTPVRFGCDENGAILLNAADTSTSVVIDGETLGKTRRLTRAEVDAGVTIMLADRVVLVLHLATAMDDRVPSAGLVGESDAIRRIRREIQRVADKDIPVLLQGEVGVGKRTTARAIHQFSRRGGAAFVHGHLTAPPALPLVVALFGAAAGDGAPAVDGCFQQADGGTLLLDGLAEAAPDVQLMLQRAIDAGAVHRHNGSRPEAVDVRIVASAERAIHELVAEKRFRQALYFLLSRYEIWVPPLRQRREDIGPLLVHFLRRSLDSCGRAHRLEPAAPGKHAWLLARHVAKMIRAPWPGNVRQLRNVAEQLALSCCERESVPKERVAELLASSAVMPLDPTPSPPPRRRQAAKPPSKIGRDEILGALDASKWNYTATARALKIARNSIYGLLKRHDIPTAKDLGVAEIRSALAECGGNTKRAARRLEVSPNALRLRMTELGLD